MKISIISSSHRINSQSKKISSFIQDNLFKIASKLDANILDLADAGLPFGHQKKKMVKVFGEKIGTQYQVTLMNQMGLF